MPAASTRPIVALRADVDEFRRLFDRSSAVEAKLRTGLRRNLRQVGDVAAKDVQRTVRQPPRNPSRSNQRHTGLRDRIAGGVKVAVLTGSTRAGVAIVTSASQLAEGQKRLLRAYGRAGGWKHPVWGDNAVWVTQVGRPGYFYQTVHAHRGESTRAVTAAMREAADSLKGP